MSEQQPFDDDRWLMEEHVGSLSDSQWELIRDFARQWAEMNQLDPKDTLLGMHMPVDWLLNKWHGGVKKGN